jgi:hypothetical protein
MGSVGIGRFGHGVSSEDRTLEMKERSASLGRSGVELDVGEDVNAIYESRNPCRDLEAVNLVEISAIQLRQVGYCRPLKCSSGCIVL